MKAYYIDSVNGDNVTLKVLSLAYENTLEGEITVGISDIAKMSVESIIYGYNKITGKLVVFDKDKVQGAYYAKYKLMGVTEADIHLTEHKVEITKTDEENKEIYVDILIYKDEIHSYVYNRVIIAWVNAFNRMLEVLDNLGVNSLDKYTIHIDITIDLGKYRIITVDMFETVLSTSKYDKTPKEYVFDSMKFSDSTKLDSVASMTDMLSPLGYMFKFGKNARFSDDFLFDLSNKDMSMLYSLSGLCNYVSGIKIKFPKLSKETLITDMFGNMKNISGELLLTYMDIAFSISKNDGGLTALVHSNRVLVSKLKLSDLVNFCEKHTWVEPSGYLKYEIKVNTLIVDCPVYSGMFHTMRNLNLIVRDFEFVTGFTLLNVTKDLLNLADENCKFSSNNMKLTITPVDNKELHEQAKCFNSNKYENMYIALLDSKIKRITSEYCYNNLYISNSINRDYVKLFMLYLLHNSVGCTTKRVALVDELTANVYKYEEER